MSRRLSVALLGLILLSGMTSAGHAASPQLKDSIQPFQLSDQHGKMRRIAAAPENTLIYFYRGDW